MHENPNPQCPVGKNIQAALEKKFRLAQVAMENELASQTLNDILQIFRTGKPTLPGVG